MQHLVMNNSEPTPLSATRVLSVEDGGWAALRAARARALAVRAAAVTDGPGLSPATGQGVAIAGAEQLQTARQSYAEQLHNTTPEQQSPVALCGKWVLDSIPEDAIKRGDLPCRVQGDEREWLLHAERKHPGGTHKALLVSPDRSLVGVSAYGLVELKVAVAAASVSSEGDVDAVAAKLAQAFQGVVVTMDGEGGETV